MSEAGNPDNFCYQHPDRQSFILCQRCGRTICADCQTQAAVGVHCPECTKEARMSAPKRKPAVVTAINRAKRSDGPVVTYSLMAVTVAIYLLQLVTKGVATSALLYWPPFTETQPWRMLTSVFVHSDQSFLHIVFNMYALFIIGRMLEPVIGRLRFLALYLLSGLGGSVAVLLIAPMTPVVGASGAVFGLFGAFFIIQRGMGSNGTQLLIVIGLNLAIGFIVPGIAWQAHVGGLLAGALVALVLLKTRRIRQQKKQLWWLGAILAGLLAATIIGVQIMHARVF